MRYGILSDIHSNLEALDAVLGELERARVSRFLCPGDIVGYGANPSECIRRVRTLDAVCVCGNHDRAAVGLLDTTWFNPYARAAVIWTEHVLREEDKAFLRGLKFLYETEAFTVVHGTLEQPDAFHYLFDLGDAAQTLEQLRSPVCFLGHTHVPVVFSLRDGELGCSFDPVVELRPDTRYIVNVGSVGQPRDGDPRAAFGLYDDEARRIELKRVPYDIAEAQAKIREAGLPEILATRLAHGR